MNILAQIKKWRWPLIALTVILLVVIIICLLVILKPGHDNNLSETTHALPLFADEPCKLNDEGCISRLATEIYQKIVKSDPQIDGLNTLDPMFEPFIRFGRVSGRGDDDMDIHYKNITIDGFKDCLPQNIGLNNATKKVKYEILCPQLKLHGKYAIKGYIFRDLYIRGTGNFEIEYKKIQMNIESYMTLETGKNGWKHLKIPETSLSFRPLEPVVFNFENLFDGNSTLAESTLKTMNDNWSRVSRAIMIFSRFTGQIEDNAKKYFDIVPISKYVDI